MVDVVVYGKPDCSLCDQVKRQLKSLTASYRFRLKEVNILEDGQAYHRFRNDIPVVFVNGKKAFKYRLDEKSFLKRLREAR